MNSSRIDVDLVHVSFDQNHPVMFPSIYFGAMKVIKYCGLFIDLRLWRIQIFWVIVWPECSPSESDHLPGFTVNREHQTAAEPIIDAAAILPFDHQPRFFEQGRAEFLKALNELLSGGIRQSQPEFVHGRTRHAPRFQIAARFGTAGSAEILLEDLSRELMHVVKSISAPCLRMIDSVAFRKWNTISLG